MSSNNNSTSNQDKAVTNEFNTYMALRGQGVDPDRAFRGADEVRRGTMSGGDAGATSAAVRVLRWLGLFAAVVIIAFIFLPQVITTRAQVSPTPWVAPALTATPQLAPPPEVPGE